MKRMCLEPEPERVCVFWCRWLKRSSPQARPASYHLLVVHIVLAVCARDADHRAHHRADRGLPRVPRGAHLLVAVRCDA